MVCEETVLPEPPTENHSVNCPLYDENTSNPNNESLCLFGSLVLHLHDIGELVEEPSKMVNLCLLKNGGFNPASFQGLCLNDFPNVENVVHVKTFL